MTNKKLTAVSLVYAFFAIFWLYINLTQGTDSDLRNYFADTYGVIALIGGIIGYLISQKWSSYRSLLGKTLLFFSIGLLFQFLGQLTYSIYFYVFGLDNPYPSLGDVFYFGSVLIYIYATILLLQLVQFKSGFSKLKTYKKVTVILFPLMLMTLTYYAFLRNYPFEGVSLIQILLDFGYPLGQTLFVSLALLAFYLSKNLLGGVLKPGILLILVALIFQYISDTYFLYQTIMDTWVVSGFGDLLFLTSYFVMTLALIKFDYTSVENLVEKENLKNDG